MDNAEVHEFWSLLVIFIAWKFCSCENIVELVEWFEEVAEIRYNVLRSGEFTSVGKVVWWLAYACILMMFFVAFCMPACLSAAVFLWRSSWWDYVDATRSYDAGASGNYVATGSNRHDYSQYEVQREVGKGEARRWWTAREEADASSKTGQAGEATAGNDILISSTTCILQLHISPPLSWEHHLQFHSGFYTMTIVSFIYLLGLSTVVMGCRNVSWRSTCAVQNVRKKWRKKSSKSRVSDHMYIYFFPQVLSGKSQ